jgi:hypothetical protein
MKSSSTKEMNAAVGYEKERGEKKARFASDMPCSPTIINCASNFSLFSGAFSLLPFRVRRRKLFLTHLQCERGQAEGERERWKKGFSVSLLHEG